MENLRVSRVLQDEDDWIFVSLLHRSDRHQKTKKRQNPTIFGKLRYRHFDMMMSQYSQMKTSHAFQGCAKIVLWLHTARLENPDTPQTHPIASNFHEYRSETPRHPSDIPKTPPQTSPGSVICQQKTTDNNRHNQTAPDTPGH